MFKFVVVNVIDSNGVLVTCLCREMHVPRLMLNGLPVFLAVR